MKKEYIKPTMKVVEAKTSCVLCGSPFRIYSKGYELDENAEAW